MKAKKKSSPGGSNNGKDRKRRSTLVIESNRAGAQYDNKGPNAEGPGGKLVDGESINDGR